MPEEAVLALSTIDETPITAEKIRQVDSNKPCVIASSPVYPSEVEVYGRRKDELSVEHDVLFWGDRVIIPPKGRDTLLDELYETHPSIVNIKVVEEAVCSGWD